MLERFGRRKPEPVSPADDYRAGREHRKQEAGARQDLSGSACPFAHDDRQNSDRRTRWLTGYYDEFVDERELWARERLGLPPINWTPPPEEAKKTKGRVRELG